jgi:hypothetical protein
VASSVGEFIRAGKLLRVRPFAGAATWFEIRKQTWLTARTGTRAFLPRAERTTGQNSRMPFRFSGFRLSANTRRYVLAAAALGAALLWSANVWLEGNAIAAAAAKLESSRNTVTFSQARPEGTQDYSRNSEQRYGDLKRDHSLGRVRYSVTPPVGGTHNPVWLNCGVYNAPVRNENAVHSLEHGAVWISYRPDDLSAAQRQQLEGLGADPRVLISPYPTQPAPVMISAWGVQLRLEKADSQRLRAFVIAHRDSDASPEPNGPCSAGTGFPAALKKKGNP